MTSETHVALSQLLSLRQREILELLRFGLTDIEIADRLNISVYGVRYHVTEIINKLGVQNRYEAANWPKQPPWWAKALAPAALFWKKASLLLPIKASSVAIGLSGASFAVAVGGLSLMGFLLGRANTDVDAAVSEAKALTVMSASREPSSRETSTREASTTDLLIASSPEPLARAAPHVRPEPPPATPATSARPATPATSARPATSAASGELAASSQSTNTPAQSPCSADACATAIPTPIPTPLPYYPGGRMAVDCDAGEAGIQSSCAYTSGSTFHIQIHVTQAPSDGYFAFQSRLRWNDAQLGYLLPASVAVEVLWQKCRIPKRVEGSEGLEPSLTFGCAASFSLAEGDTTTGAILQLQYQCEEDGMTPVELVSREDDHDPQGGTFFMGRWFNYPSDPLLASAHVACGDQGGEPCPPDCPAPSPTPTAPTTPTPTTAPTTPTAPTPAPAPVEPGSMAVDCAAAKAGIQSNCEYASGASFSIQVHVTDPPSEGYFGFHTKLRWSDKQLDYLPASDPADSGLWRRCDLAMSWDGQLISDASLTFGCLPLPLPSEGDTTTGAVLEFNFQCQADGLTNLTLMPIAGDPQGGTYFLSGFMQPIQPALAGATVRCG